MLDGLNQVWISFEYAPSVEAVVGTKTLETIAIDPLVRPDRRNDTVARVFITGSSDGLGLMTGELLASQGRSVVLHVRNEVRAQHVLTALPKVDAVLIGDLSTIAAMRAVAIQANALEHFDAVIHNVAIGYRKSRRVGTEDGHCHSNRVWRAARSWARIEE
jgi:NAD(P)-dependent dehydrogenase (short-subunit alcohol dehydrogenase family)